MKFEFSLVYKAIDCCKEAIQRFYKEDYNLIEMNSSERSMVFRIGLYINEIVSNDENLREYNIDCEYNRKNFNPKRIDSGCITPDLLIHKRGTNKNLIAVEFKKSGNSLSHDKDKLSILTNQNGEYGYKAGLLIILEKNSFKIFEYCNGILENRYKEKIFLT